MKSAIYKCHDYDYRHIDLTTASRQQTAEGRIYQWRSALQSTDNDRRRHLQSFQTFNSWSWKVVDIHLQQSMARNIDEYIFNT